MLDQFIVTNRDTILERARARVAARERPKPTAEELVNGIPVFLDQLGDALQRARSTDVADHEQLQATAGRHGQDLLRMGLTVAQVVRDYGDVCQVITELAIEQQAAISPTEYRVLNLCLDDATSQAVTEFARMRERAIETTGIERLGELAHELRNLLNVASLAFDGIRSGRVAPGGSTSAMLGRSLMGLRDLVDRSLADVRLEAGIELRELIPVAAFVEDVEIGALLQAESHAVQLVVTPVDPSLHVEGDRQSLAAALANLLQNAFKFTPRRGTVTLKASAVEANVLFEVEDECGGLPPGSAEDLFRPFEQRGADRSGVGLGLSICKKAARTSGGKLTVRDLPGKGCVFTLELPRKSPPPLQLVNAAKAGRTGDA